MAWVNIEHLRSSDAQQSATIVNPILLQRALLAEPHPDGDSGEVAQISVERLRSSCRTGECRIPKLSSESEEGQMWSRTLMETLEKWPRSA